QLHGGLERLHVAPDHPGRAAAVHVARGAGGAVARAHHGRGDDDGRCGVDRIAGAAAVPAAAALVHGRAAARQRERLMCMRNAILMMLLGLAAFPAAAQEALSTRLLDGFEEATPWSVVASDQVSAAIRM